MGVYVGMDLHRKRSQVAVVDDTGAAQRNPKVANDPAKLVPILGVLPPGTPVAFEAAYGWGGWSSCGRTWSWNRTWSIPAAAKPSPQPGCRNDKVDAATLAQRLLPDLLPEAWIAPSRSGSCGRCWVTGPAWSAWHLAEEPGPCRAGRPRHR